MPDTASERLHDELKKIENSEEEFLPDYGYTPRDEILLLIKQEIDDLRWEDNFEYTDEELEKERTHLCTSQGIARYC